MAPHVCVLPGSTRRKFRPPETFTGFLLNEMEEEVPSTPWSLLPQQYAAPPAAIPQAYCPPGITWRQWCPPKTSVGTRRRAAVVLSPTAPLVLSPEQYARLSVVRPQLVPRPHAPR